MDGIVAQAAEDYVWLRRYGLILPGNRLADWPKTPTGEEAVRNGMKCEDAITVLYFWREDGTLDRLCEGVYRGMNPRMIREKIGWYD